MTHDELARDLAAHLHGPDRMTWCDLQLGPSGSPRPDVYTLCKSYRNPAPTAYECKVSRADFLADVTAGKWQTYLAFASAVWFACEVGLVGKQEVPAHCGLIVRHPSGAWRAAKRAIVSPVVIPQEAFLKLLIDGVQREGPQHRRRTAAEHEWDVKIRTSYGEDVAKAVSDLRRARFDAESAKHTAADIIADAKRRAEHIRKEEVDRYAPARAELCALLGLATDASRWQIERKLRELRSSLKEHPAQERLRYLTASIRGALSSYGYVESVAALEPVEEGTR